MNNVFSSTNVDLYHLLDLEHGESNQNLIKKNFSNLIKLFHSDRGGDSKFHQQLVEAYRILSDPTRKFIYDNYGLLGVYSLKEEDEDISIIETILTSPHSTEEDIKTIKIFLKKKIMKRIKKLFLYSMNHDFITADITSNYTTGVFDYVYLKYLMETKNLALGKNFVSTRFSLNNNFTLFKSKDNQKELSLNINYSVDKSNLNTQHTYSINFNNKLKLPFALKIFDNNYIDTDLELIYHNDSENLDIAIKKSLTIANLFYKSPLSFTVSPTYSLLGNNLESLELELAHSPSPSKSFKTKLDVFGKCLDSVFTWKPKNTDTKYIGFLNLGSNFLIGLYMYQTKSNSNACSHSIMLRNNTMILNNESIIVWKSFIFKLISGLQFAKKQENLLSFSSTLSLQLQFKSFKINIPIVISGKQNVFTQGMIFFSTIAINIGIELYKQFNKLLKRKPSHIKIYDKINYEKQIKFNQENLNYSLELNKKDSEKMTILHAYIGEISKICEIFKYLEIFGFYNNLDSSIFDIRIPLSLRVVDSKLEITKDITDIEGVYFSDFYNKDKIGYLIIYTFGNQTYSIINRNNEKELFLP